MHTWVYKSCKKANTYLYIAHKDDFSKLPKVLVDLIGEVKLVLNVDLSKRRQLALADIDTVRQDLRQYGFYLQLPPGDLKPEKIC